MLPSEEDAIILDAMAKYLRKVTPSGTVGILNALACEAGAEAIREIRHELATRPKVTRLSSLGEIST